MTEELPCAILEKRSATICISTFSILQNSFVYLYGTWAWMMVGVISRDWIELGLITSFISSSTFDTKNWTLKFLKSTSKGRLIWMSSEDIDKTNSCAWFTFSKRSIIYGVPPKHKGTRTFMIVWCDTEITYTVYTFFLFVDLQLYIICTLVWIRSIISYSANGKVSVTRCLLTIDTCHKITLIFLFINTAWF